MADDKTFSPPWETISAVASPLRTDFTPGGNNGPVELYAMIHTPERPGAQTTCRQVTLVLGNKPKPSAAAPAGQEYVDPFLFESGHFESREEYEELSRTAKIKPRARA